MFLSSYALSKQRYKKRNDHQNAYVQNLLITKIKMCNMLINKKIKIIINANIQKKLLITQRHIY
jgi:hypothetical protein